jgi:Transposase domain (DUF772)
VFSSHNVERSTYDSVAFRFIAANEHPDHDTIAAFRRRFLPQIEALFVQVLNVAREMGVLKLGTVALDGTKIHANASRHSALSYEHAGQIEAQLKAEVAELMPKAETTDQADVLARISHRIGCIGAGILRESCCDHGFSRIHRKPQCRQTVTPLCLNFHPSKAAR